MRRLLPIALLCFASTAWTQTLNLPPRGTAAPGGKAFAEKISPLGLAEREKEILKEVSAGNIPEFLRKFCPVTITNTAGGRTNTATFYVAPDYLAIGSDADYFLAPMSPSTAQRIGDQLGCTLPTRKMVDAIYSGAEVQLAPMPIPPSAAMTTVPVFLQHNEMVHTQRVAVLNSHPLGALTAGNQKDVVISARLSAVTNKVAIYGWHQTNGIAIQPLYLGHAASWVDYSQCIRLVKNEMIVNGEIRKVAEVLADPKLCGLLSDEGVITNARYPTNNVGDDVRGLSSKLNNAPKSDFEIPHVVPSKERDEFRESSAVTNFDFVFPQKFSASGHFGELAREIELPNSVRILINAPSKESFAPDKPVLLVFFALPNGNTIEQTIGKALKPGADWHFDIQHIGAQTRWLRNAITNRTIVVAYLEAGTKSWPAWRKTHDDPAIVRLVDGVREIFSGNKTEVVLASHSGGGSLIFGYLNAVEKIPDAVKRIAFLDSNYGYDSKLHAVKIESWLAASGENRLCVLAYQDYLGLLNGKTFVSESGGTWGRSHLMLDDLGAQFKFTGSTNHGLETFSALGGRIQFLLKENPERKIFHTVQVERNGFIHALVSGTADEGREYEYFGGRAYTKWIADE